MAAIDRRNGSLVLPLLLAFSTSASAQPRFVAPGPHHVATVAADTAAVLAADVDGDGRPDLLAIDAQGRHGLHRAHGDGTFASAPRGALPETLGPHGGALAVDVTGDGVPDLLLARPAGFADRLLVGRGDGTFREGQALAGSMAWTTRSFAACDLDRDGDVDVVALRDGLEPALYRNDGVVLRLDTVWLSGTPSDARVARCGDLDRDGWPDLVLLHASGFDVVRGGALQPIHVSLALAEAASAVDLLLFDPDQDQDLDVALVFPDRFEVYENRGRFVFASTSRWRVSLPGDVRAAALGDLDGDARPDVALARRGAALALLVRSNGLEERAIEAPDTQRSSRGLVLFDADGDLDLDVFFACEHARDVLYLNDGGAHFALATGRGEPILGAPARRLRAYDLDADGDLDLVGTCGEGIDLFWNLGDGRFARHVDPELARWDRVRDVWVGDLDGDRRAELFLARSGPGGAPVRQVLLAADTRWVFRDVSAARLPAEDLAGEAVAAGDVDGDGRLDLIIAGRGTHHALWLADGSRGFRARPGAFPLSELPDAGAVALADFDGDGDPDVLFGDRAGADVLFRNRGGGTFERATTPGLHAVHTDTRTIALGDFDRDGRTDLFLGVANGSPRLLLGRADGRFQDVSFEQLPAFSGTIHAAAAADVDGDGALDLLLACGTDPIPDRVWINDGAASFAEATAAWAAGDRHTSWALVAGDWDGDGDVDLASGAGTLRHGDFRQLDVDTLARPGRFHGWRITGWAVRRNDAPQVYLHLSTRRLHAPWPTPFGAVWLDPGAVTWVRKETLPPGGAAVVVGGGVPLDPALVGGEIFAQGVVLHRLTLADVHVTGLLRTVVEPQ